MKERPILFSGAMVRAILNGSKSQTRRIVKPQPQMVTDTSIEPWRGDATDLQRLLDAGGRGCPYGQPGDRLWVKETWRPMATIDPWDLDVVYAADGATRRVKDGEFGEKDWRMPKAAARGNVSPLFMPRWASRITLEITGVRVERLNDINEADAIAEGVTAVSSGGVTLFTTTGVNCFQTAKDAYAALWESINGPDSWDANPWVWVVEFHRIAQEARADA